MVQPLFGQSNFDLCLQVVGGFDSFIGFLSSNGVQISAVPPTSEVKFNTVQSKVLSGYKYASYSFSVVLQPILDNDGTPLLDNNGQPIYNN